MAKITLTFEDTKEMRAVLHQLAAHCHDDNVPFWESEAKENVRRARAYPEGDSIFIAATAASKHELALAKANAEFAHEVTVALQDAICMSCDVRPIKYIDGLCERCHQIAVNVSNSMEKSK